MVSSTSHSLLYNMHYKGIDVRILLCWMSTYSSMVEKPFSNILLYIINVPGAEDYKLGG